MLLLSCEGLMIYYGMLTVVRGSESVGVQHVVYCSHEYLLIQHAPYCQCNTVYVSQCCRGCKYDV